MLFMCCGWVITWSNDCFSGVWRGTCWNSNGEALNENAMFVQVRLFCLSNLSSCTALQQDFVICKERSKHQGAIKTLNDEYDEYFAASTLLILRRPFTTTFPTTFSLRCGTTASLRRSRDHCLAWLLRWTWRETWRNCCSCFTARAVREGGDSAAHDLIAAKRLGFGDAHWGNLNKFPLNKFSVGADLLPFSPDLAQFITAIIAI